MAIKLKLLIFVIGTLVITTIAILIAVNMRFVTVIDENQHALYTERVDTILGILQGYDERLHMTGQVEAYSDAFRNAAIEALKKTYYRQKNQPIYPFIINHNEEFVMHPNLSAGDLSVVKSALVSKMRSSTMRASGDFESEKKWFLFKRFENWNWVVTYTVPLEIKYAEVQKLRQILISIMIGVTTLSIIVMWAAIVQITKPIRILMQGARAIAVGNYSSVIDVTGSGELLQLIRDFNHMAEAVNDKVVDLNREIYERKQAEKMLQVSHERFFTVLNSIDANIYVADMQSYEILFMNKSLMNTFGRDLTGERCWEGFKGKSEPCKHCTNDQLIDANGNPTGLCTWQNKNPVTGKWYINNDRAIEWSDGRLVRIEIATDITDLKNMEEELRQTQKMESIGILAGGIAHDFNNILFPIVGHAEMLMDDLSEENSSIRNSLKEIHTGALRAKDLVQQILAFSRQKTNELKRMNMQPIIKEALKLIRSTIPTTISIHQSLQPECRPIEADPTKIHQIVMNLATNAYHAMEETGGELKVSLKEIELGEYDLIVPDMTPGLYACLTVADTGVGMDKALIYKIFDPFFTTKPIGKSTGMGLSVVHGIVKSMNGEIQVYSEPGKGTEFHVYLPLAEAVKEQKATNVEVPIQGGTEHILIVDDEEAILTMEKQVLKRLGYQVTSRFSSLEALEAFRANSDKFDLVITDMAMPNMPGDKLSVELTKIRPDIPVLLCTGFSETMSEEKALAMGIKGFLMKPVTINNFDKTIRAVLDKKNV